MASREELLEELAISQERMIGDLHAIVEDLRGQLQGLLPHAKGHSDVAKQARLIWDAALHAHMAHLQPGDPGPVTYILRGLLLAYGRGLEHGRVDGAAVDGLQDIADHPAMAAASSAEHYARRDRSGSNDQGS